MKSHYLLEAAELYSVKHDGSHAVVLGCTEYPLVVDQTNSLLPIIDPVYLQAQRAIEFALGEG